MEKITIKNAKMLDFGVSCKNEKGEHKYWTVEIVVSSAEKKRLCLLGSKEFAKLRRNEFIFTFFPKKEPRAYNRLGRRITRRCSGDILVNLDVFAYKNGSVKGVDIHFIDFIENESLCKFLDKRH